MKRIKCYTEGIYTKHYGKIVASIKDQKGNTNYHIDYDNGGLIWLPSWEVTILSFN